MLQSHPFSIAPQFAAVRFSGTRERIVLSLVLCALIRSGEAFASDQPVVIGGGVNSQPAPLRDSEVPVRAPAMSTSASPLAPSTSASPPALGDFTAPKLGDIKVFSDTEFCPRKHARADDNGLGNVVDDNPMLWNSTVWQRMNDYRSRDRVRLLTLWESSGSSVSLQAGRHGDPSLQWTSRSMNRGGSTRGVLDQLFSVSIAGAGEKLHGASRSASSQEPPAKQIITEPVTAAAK